MSEPAASGSAPVLPDDLVLRGGTSRTVLLVLDGLGGLPQGPSGTTELEAAHTPHLDALARESTLGRLVPVAPGVTPGSGPAHLALFGYDPLECIVGRGTLSALGVDFDLRPGDLAARLNLATFDADGRVVDRRAGRPPDGEGVRAVRRLEAGLRAPEGYRLFLRHEREHRAVLVLRGPDLDARIQDTDPQEVGVPPLDPAALHPAAEATAVILRDLLAQARLALRGEDRINGVLARGFDRFDEIPGFETRFGMRGAAWALYPMYRGVARLVGMEVPGVPSSDEEAVSFLEQRFRDFDFHFVHFKAPDARGEDGDFEGKARAIEAVDALIPRIAALDPDVLVVTGDHSTPAAMAVHSWHPIPLLLRSKWARPTADYFGESACRAGDIGTLESRHLMSLVLAHAGRLAKFGA
jgi:2,3-bisphosphoglycerate-independent phosphoglycerate mutase